MTVPIGMRWQVVKPAANPAAGAELTYTNNEVGALLVHSLVFRLATSAVAGQRAPIVVVDDTTDVYARVVPSAPQGPSATVDYSGLADIPGAAAPPNVPTTQTPANPAAGAEISTTVTSGHTEVLESVKFRLVTSAAVANRQVALVIDDGTNIVAEVVSATVQAAGATVDYVFSGTVEDSALRNGVQVEPLPPLTIGPGWRIRTVTANLQAADQFSATVLTFNDNTLGAFGSYALPLGGLIVRRGHRLRTITTALDAGDQYSGLVMHAYTLLRDPDRFVQPVPLPLYEMANG